MRKSLLGEPMRLKMSSRIGSLSSGNFAVKSRFVRVFRGAKEDLRDGFAFYEAQERGLGDYFYDCLMSDIDALAYYGGVHRQYRGFYKALSARFPFAIYYKLSDGTVRVYAVLDNRRNPERNDVRLSEAETDD